MVLTSHIEITPCIGTLVNSEIFSRSSIGDLAVGAAQQHVGLDADLAHLLHGVLRGLGLQLAGGGDEGHVGEVDEGRVGGAQLERHLAHGLEEGQGLDVAHRAADLADRHVDRVHRGAAAHEFLDLVGDVRDHLHRLAEVVAAALLLEHRLVDLARGEVVAALHARVDEALVVAEVEVGLRAVVGDEHLAVLHRGHRARIDVEVRIQLDEGDLEAARFEDRRQGSRCDALAKRGHHAAGDEDELGHVSGHLLRGPRRSGGQRAGPPQECLGGKARLYGRRTDGPRPRGTAASPRGGAALLGSGRARRPRACALRLADTRCPCFVVPWREVLARQRASRVRSTLCSNWCHLRERNGAHAEFRFQTRGTSHGHDHHEGRHARSTTRTGARASQSCSQPRLAAVSATTGTARCCSSWPARLSRHRARPPRPRPLRPRPGRQRHGHLRRRSRRAHRGTRPARTRSMSATRPAAARSRAMSAAHGTRRVAKAVLISAVPPLMLKTDGQSRRPADRGLRRLPRRRRRQPRRSSIRDVTAAVLRLQPARREGVRRHPRTGGAGHDGRRSRPTTTASRRSRKPTSPRI